MVLVTRSPSLAFQETSQAFVDVNSSFMFRPNLGSACFSARLLVKQMAELYERLLKGGNWFVGNLCLLDLTPAPFFQRVGGVIFHLQDKPWFHALPRSANSQRHRNEAAAHMK
jgi:glutathione S-transferase